MTGMRSISLALLSVALLVAVSAIGPTDGNAQQQRRPGATTERISLDGRYLAARVAEQDHDYDRAADQIDQALLLSPNDPELVYAAFRLRLYAGRFDSALQLAPAVLAAKPGDGFANLVVAVSLIKKGDNRAAELQLGKIGSENQLGPLRDYVVAWLKAGDKDFTAARELMSRNRPKAGGRDEAPALIIQAQFDEMAGDRAAAESKYRRAAQLDPTAIRAVLSAADGLRRLGKADDARTLLKALGDRFGDTIVMDGLMAASAPTAKLPTPASGVSDILFDIGSILSSDPRNQRADLALIFLQLAVELKPDADFAWLTISAIYEQWGVIPKAVAALGKISPTSPFSWQARLRIAALDAQEERFDQAVTKLKALVAEKPTRIDAAITLADLLRGKERWAEAIAASDTAIQRIAKLEERHWAVYFGRAIALERSKQWPLAEADIKKALELSPEQPYALNYLGYSWIDQGMHLDEGMKMLKRANELKPDDGAITDSVGWAYYRLGKFDQAVEWLERASEQKSDDATIVEHLGDAYWHVGRKREARFEWLRALNQKPDKERIPIINDKLANGLNSSNDKPTVYEKAADKK